MNTHLRHCPKHKKKLPCPHCALTAAPVAVVAVLDPPEPLPEQKRRGRPPKYGETMSPAEQKRRKRAEQRATQEQRDRRDLIADLMQRFRRMQQEPFFEDRSEAGRAAAAEAAANLAYQRHAFYRSILFLPLEELTATRDAWKTTPDRHGAANNNMREVNVGTNIEVVYEAQLRDEDSDGGRRVKPCGTDPRGYEGSDDGWGAGVISPHDDTLPSASDDRNNADYTPEVKPWLSKKIDVVAWWLTRSGRCSVCGIQCDDEHIWSEYWKGAEVAERKDLYDEAAQEIRDELHRVNPDVAQHIEYVAFPPFDSAHWDEITKLLRKHWKFFGEKDAPEAKDLTVDGLRAEGWVFFSSRWTRHEVLVRSQAEVDPFFTREFHRLWRLRRRANYRTRPKGDRF
jgi:hypothetical protein